MRKGFSLVELIIVIVVIGILATFAMPQFAVTKERALDKEAKAVLALIQAAEKTYKMEEGDYYPPSPYGSIDTSTAANINTINTDLRLSLSPSLSWNYAIDSSNSWVTATRSIPGGGRFWRMNFTTDTINCTDGASDRCPSL